MRIKKKILAALIGAISLFIPIATALALIYSSTISITNTGSAIGQYPFLFSFNTTGLISGRYVSAPATDVRVSNGSTNLPRMLADNKLLFAAPVPVGSSSYDLTTGNAASDFSVITGYNGYVTIPYNAALDIGDNFSIDVNGPVNTIAGANKILWNQVGTGSLYVSPSISGNITGEIITSGGGYTLGTPANIETKSYNTVAPVPVNRNLAFTSTGRAWAFLYDYNVSVSLGVYYADPPYSTWTLSDSFTDNVSGNSLALCIDSGDHLLAVYQGTGSSIYSRYFDGSWSSPVLAADSANFTWTMMGFSVGVDSTDKFHMVFSDFYNLKHTTLSAYNGTWSGTSLAASTNATTSSISTPQLVIDSGDNIHVVYPADYNPEVGGGYTRIAYAHYNGTWDVYNEYISSADNRTTAYPSIAVTSANVPWVSYTTYSLPSNGIFDEEFSAFRVGTNNWTKEPISTRVNMDNGGVISINRSDIPCVIYDSSYYDPDRGGFFVADYMKYKTRTGGVWSSPVIIGSLAGTDVPFSSLNATYPVIDGVHTNLSDGPFTWIYGNNAQSDIFFQTFNTGSSTTITVSASGLSPTSSVQLRANSANLTLWIDGVQRASTSLGGGSANVSGNDMVIMSNATSYLNSFKISKNGTQELWYQPVSYIVGDNLPDRESTQNGVITWGSNLGTISGNISGFTPVSSAMSAGNRPDILPNQPIDYVDKGNAPAQKTDTPSVTGLSDVIHVWSQMWQFNTDSVGWVFLAMLLTLFVFWLFAWKLQHTGYAFIASSIVIGFFSAPGINVLPLGGLIFAVLGLVSGVVVEQRA